ncbi:MAG TPA: substrate-binding domain-containing protein [Vicinamibacteria bacterium]|nr:substrate-binding domain-containing protein [Vicinamibacteria bacterium]
MPARVVLALVDESNQFQKLLKSDAEAAGREAGIEVETVFTGESLVEHLGALRRLIVDPGRRPAALLVMAVRDHGLDRVAREAAGAGVHFVLLNAVEDDLDAVRREFPAAVVSTVCPDEVETGRVQGRQLLALVPAGRRVLYIQGSLRSLASRERTSGMREATAGAPFEVVLAGGDWSPAFAGRTVREWLRFAVGGRIPFDLVACQNDHMAGGALEALAAAAAETGKPDVARIPVAGCDGAPDVGQRMVREGRLVATVVLPRVAGPAVQEVAALLARGERPAPVITHAATSFPPLPDLRPIA